MFFILFFIVLFFSLDAQARNHPNHSIGWTPGRIEETLGFEGKIDIRATFVSSKKLSDVNLWIVPNLQRFVSLEQTHFDSIKPHTPYEVIVHLSVPHGTRPGSYRGTVHLGVGECRHAERFTLPQTLKIKLNVVYENVSIPSTTKVLDESTTQYLLSVSTDGAILIFSRITRDLRSLSPGDIIVIGITAATQMGFCERLQIFR